MLLTYRKRNSSSLFVSEAGAQFWQWPPGEQVESKWRRLKQRSFFKCLSIQEHSRLWLCSEVIGPSSEKTRPVRNSTEQLCEKSHHYRCLQIAKLPERLGPSDERLERVEEAFQRSHLKTSCSVSRELGIPQPTLWRIILKRLRVRTFCLPFRHSSVPNL